MNRLDLNIGNKQFLKFWKKIAKKLFSSFPIEGAIPKTIVEEKELFQPGIDSFAGLNQRTRDLPKRCFINNHQIIFSDVVIDKLIPFIVNIDEINSVRQLYDLYDNTNSLNILDVSRDPIIYFFDGRYPSIWNHSLKELQNPKWNNSFKEMFH